MVFEQQSQIVLQISKESITIMLSLNGSGFLKKNIITLSEDVLVQKFVSTPSQVQLSFTQSIQRAKYITLNLEFP